MIPALAKAINSLFFSWPVRSELAIQGTAASSFSVCVCRWYKLGVNLVSDLFAADFAGQCIGKFSLPPSTIPIGYLCDMRIGPVFSLRVNHRLY